MRCLVVSLFVVVVCVVPVAAREWTDSTGRYKVQAEFAGLSDGIVSLKKSDGIVIQVPIDKLSRADQEFARRAPANKNEAVAPQKRDDNVRGGSPPAPGEAKVDRDVERLIAALNDENSSVREAAAESLEEIGYPAVKPLVRALIDKGRGSKVRSQVATVLGNILNSPDPPFRPLVVGSLASVLTDKDLKVVDAAMKSLLLLEAQNELIRALNTHGNKDMAESLIKWGDRRLQAAAHKWAKEHGYVYFIVPAKK